MPTVSATYRSELEVNKLPMQAGTYTLSLQGDGRLAYGVDTEITSFDEGTELTTDTEITVSEYITFVSTRGFNKLTISTTNTEVVFGPVLSQEERTQEQIDGNSTSLENIAYFQGFDQPTDFEYPEWFTDSIKDDVNIVMLGYTATTDHDFDQYKNTGGTTLYVDITNDFPGSGTSGDPYKFLYSAINAASSGDTILIAEGLYYRQAGTNSQDITKSLNIIGSGNVAITTHDVLSYTKSVGYTNIYESARSNCPRIVKLDGSYDIDYELELVGSVEECDNTDNSWYTDNVTIWVNYNGGVEPDSLMCPLVTAQCIDSKNTTQNTNLYLEGIKFYGGANGVVRMQNSATYTECNLAMKNCKALVGLNETRNNVDLFGVTISATVGCDFSYGVKDGIGYHALNGVVGKFIEYNNTGDKNGSDDGADNYNGSTSHDGVKGIRINCSYRENIGSNVADVNTGTDTINVCCTSKNSRAVNASNRRDFDAQQSGARMHLERCITTDSDSTLNLNVVTGAEMYANRTLYETSNADGKLVRTYKG